MEALLPGLFRIEVPLPQSPLQTLNSYVFRGKDRHLVVDTGFNREECFQTLSTALQSLELAPEQTDFFITHLHADHYGLVSRLAHPSSRIFFSRPDAEVLETWEGFEPMIAYAGMNGFPENELRQALDQHPGNKYGTEWIPGLSVLRDGERIHYGEYDLFCVETPGHTLGHVCLYNPEHRFLISGDHILGDITPNIQCWSDAGNPLDDYFRSLEKVDRMDVDLVLPGHRSLVMDFHGRIAELRRHHEARLREIETILAGDGQMCAYDVAGKMTWDIRCDRWEDFPVAQKWFATGEAIAHLRFLERRETIRRSASNGKLRFHICGKPSIH
ncbi:MBL fold metallo-hydrolase [Desulfatirhabdium butyrativorans]|uniref:MBL fold metallo-hydrolase n=1 Tax=Desulfatirhabdium butyrativorans TaxID=340467 RepID=UPI00041E49AC|nr:MBL fold metallo-hydrolase [Desulfatirhabdium butyrativorans]